MSNEEQFLTAWKKAIKLLPKYMWVNFHADSLEAIESATDKDALRPDFSKIQNTLSTASSGENLYLVALYSFYCHSNSMKLADEFCISPPTIGHISRYFSGSKYWECLEKLAKHNEGW